MSKKIYLICVLAAMLVAASSGMAAAQTAKDSASKAINDAENVIFDMGNMGFGVSYANDTLNEAKILFLQERYVAAESVAKNVPLIMDTAVRVRDLIDTVESRIYDFRSKGYDIVDATSLFNSSLAEFDADNYVESEKSLNLAISSLDETEAKESAKRAAGTAGIDLLPIILDNLMLITSMFILVLIAGLKGQRMHAWRKAKKRTKMLENEQKILISGIKNFQEKYYKLGTISKSDYEVSVEKYNRNLNDIKNELSVLRVKFTERHS